MRFEAYIRVLSDEATIRSLYSNVNVPEVVIEQLKARKEGTDEKWWNWQTAKVEIDDFANIDREVRALLERYRPFFANIRNWPGPNSDIYLELVSYYEENERPSGLYLSADSLRLLAELGAAIDNDAVPDVIFGKRT
jgi:hypothetical protein